MSFLINHVVDDDTVDAVGTLLSGQPEFCAQGRELTKIAAAARMSPSVLRAVDLTAFQLAFGVNLERQLLWVGGGRAPKRNLVGHDLDALAAAVDVGISSHVDRVLDNIPAHKLVFQALPPWPERRYYPLLDSGGDVSGLLAIWTDFPRPS